MFLSELLPICRKVMQQPLAFTGGFFSGLLRLNLDEDPLAGWLNKQGFDPQSSSASSNNNNQGPQSISIE